MGEGSIEYKLGRLNGRYVITWQEDGRRPRHRLRQGITLTQANADLAAFVADRNRLLAVETETVADLFPLYLDDRKADGKNTAKQEFSWKALKPVFGHLRPSDIDKKVCRAYQKARLAAGRQIGTVWTDLSVLRAALNWAENNNKLKKAPFIHLPPQPEPNERYLTREEAKRLLAGAATPHIQLFILLALTTAGRASALLELEWDRVGFDMGQIDLRTSEVNRHKRRAIIPINDTLRQALELAKKGALTKYVIEYGGDRVTSIRKAFSRAAERAGLGIYEPSPTKKDPDRKVFETDVTPHVLRHTAAVWMAEADVPMTVIAQYLGHTNSKITEKVYARYSPSYLRRAAESLNVPNTVLIEAKKGAVGGSLNLLDQNDTGTEPTRAAT